MGHIPLSPLARTPSPSPLPSSPTRYSEKSKLGFIWHLMLSRSPSPLSLPLGHQPGSSHATQVRMSYLSIISALFGKVCHRFEHFLVLSYWTFLLCLRPSLLVLPFPVSHPPRSLSQGPSQPRWVSFDSFRSGEHLSSTFFFNWDFAHFTICIHGVFLGFFLMPIFLNLFWCSFTILPCFHVELS